MATLPPAVPTYALYGEADWPSPIGFGHIEAIAERSALHDWTIAPHRHDRAIQVLVVVAGQAVVTLGSTPFELSGPAYIVVPADVVHSFRFVPGTCGQVLTLAQNFVARGQGSADPLTKLLTAGGHGRLAAEPLARVERLARELAGLTPSAPVADPLFDALAEALMRSLTPPEATSPSDRRLAVFRHLVETHLAEHRPMDFYASSIGTTVRTLTRLCQRRLGASPQVLINRRLALEAQRRLRQPGATVTSVAAELGFEDASYFSRFYLRETGQRPSSELLDQ